LHDWNTNWPVNSGRPRNSATALSRELRGRRNTGTVTQRQSLPATGKLPPSRLLALRR